MVEQQRERLAEIMTDNTTTYKQKYEQVVEYFDTELASLLEAVVIKKNAGDILTEQARYYLGDCLNELKYSRPAWEQKLIHNWISEWNAQKVILLGDTWTAEDILGDEE